VSVPRSSRLELVRIIGITCTTFKAISMPGSLLARSKRLFTLAEWHSSYLLSPSDPKSRYVFPLKKCFHLSVPKPGTVDSITTDFAGGTSDVFYSQSHPYSGATIPKPANTISAFLRKLISGRSLCFQESHCLLSPQFIDRFFFADLIVIFACSGTIIETKGTIHESRNSTITGS